MPDGHEMDDDAWNADFVRSIGMMLWGNAIEEVDERGEVITGDTLLLLLNAHSDPVPFAMPRLDGDQQWLRVLDTAEPAPCCEKYVKPGDQFPLQGRSVAVLSTRWPIPCARSSCGTGGNPAKASTWSAARRRIASAGGCGSQRMSRRGSRPT